MNHAVRSGAQHRKMILTESLKKAIQFNHAENCKITIDNGVYSDLYGDDYSCVIDTSFNNVTVNLDAEHFTISTNDNTTKIPLTAISDINYLYDDECCYLFFNLEHFYNVNICFDKPDTKRFTSL